MGIYRNINGMLTKTGPPVGCEAEPLLAGTAEGARDIETQRLTPPVLDCTFIDIWSTRHCYSSHILLSVCPRRILRHIWCLNIVSEQVNTLRAGDADLRFYITTLQDG